MKRLQLLAALLLPACTFAAPAVPSAPRAAEALALRALIDREPEGERRAALQSRLDDVRKTLVERS